MKWFLGILKKMYLIKKQLQCLTIAIVFELFYTQRTMSRVWLTSINIDPKMPQLSCMLTKFSWAKSQKIFIPYTWPSKCKSAQKQQLSLGTVPLCCTRQQFKFVKRFGELMKNLSDLPKSKTFVYLTNITAATQLCQGICS